MRINLPTEKLQFGGLKILRFTVCFLALFFSACSLFDQANQDAQSSNLTEEDFTIPATNIDLVKPLEISNRPKDAALCQRINQTIENSRFSKARWGLIAIGLSDGRIICSKKATRLFSPASVHKLLTSIVSLDKLGDNYHSKTSIYVNGEIRDGVLKGNLYLYGRGAPDLDDTGLEKLVNQLKKQRLKKIEGDIIGDESYFKGDGLGDGWTWNVAQWYYGAAASALSVNENQVTVTLQNGRPKADEKFVDLSGEVERVEGIKAIGLKRELGTNKIHVWGNGKKSKC